MNKKNLNECGKIRDLGIILDRKWTFEEHIRVVVAKAFKTLGFIKRTTAQFSNIETIIYLYKSLVLPVLNYGSIIWSPYLIKDIDKLNAVTKNFLRYISFKKGTPMSVEDHNYKEISTECNIHKIESLHRLNDLYFVLDNMSGKFNTPNFSDYFKKRENFN